MFNKWKKDLGVFDALGLTFIFLFSLLHLIKFPTEIHKYLVVGNIRMGIQLTMILVIILTIYWGIFSSIDLNKISLKKIVIYAALAGLFILPVKPLFSNDLYSYVYRARMITEYDANPYLQTYFEFREDEFYDQLKNEYSSRYTIYGPLFFYISDIVSTLAGDSLIAHIYIFKFFAYLAFVLTVYLVWLITKSKEAVFLYSWNPVVLFHVLVETHNDIYMILLLLAGIYLIFSQRIWRVILGWILVSASVQIKYFNIILLPFIYFYIVSKSKESHKYKLAFSLPIIAVAVFGVIYLSYWDNLVHFFRLSGVSVRYSQISSPGVYLTYIISGIFISDHNIIASLSARISQMIFVLLYILISIKALLNFASMKSTQMLLYIVLAYSAMLVFFYSWFHFWYILLLFALLCVNWGLKNSFIKSKIIMYTSFLIIVIQLFYYF